MFNNAQPYDSMVSWVADRLPDPPERGKGNSLFSELEIYCEVLAAVYRKDSEEVEEDILSDYRYLHDIETEED